jgi:hypothetical protein
MAAKDAMTVGQFKEWLMRNRIPDDTPIVSAGHYGEVDGELSGLDFIMLKDSSTYHPVGPVVVLSGFGQLYPEPD